MSQLAKSQFVLYLFNTCGKPLNKWTSLKNVIQFSFRLHPLTGKKISDGAQNRQCVYMIGRTEEISPGGKQRKITLGLIDAV